MESVKKKVRYDVPTYEKFYTLYQYDRLKFRSLMNKWLETEDGKNRTLETLKAKQKEILEECYIRDKKGNKLRDCDEPYILSIGRLQRGHELIFKELQTQGIITAFDITHRLAHMIAPEIFEEKPYEREYKKMCFVVHHEEKQAELKGTWRLPIKERIRLHVEVLRKLRMEN